MGEHDSNPVHLMTAANPAHARVIAARLKFEGVPTALRGLSDGPYPLPAPVDVLVRSDQLDLAREILLGDAVDAVFMEDEHRVPTHRPRRRLFRKRREEG